MKRKSFISQASHISLHNLTESILIHKSELELAPNTLLCELHNKHQELEKIFHSYKSSFNELHRLIGEYEVYEIQIKKLIRQIQLAKKTQLNEAV